MAAEAAIANMRTQQNMRRIAREERPHKIKYCVAAVALIALSAVASYFLIQKGIELTHTSYTKTQAFGFCWMFGAGGLFGAAALANTYSSAKFVKSENFKVAKRCSEQFKKQFWNTALIPTITPLVIGGIAVTGISPV